MSKEHPELEGWLSSYSTCLAEELGLMPSIHIVSHLSVVPGNPTPFSDLCRSQACKQYIYIHAGKTYIYIKVFLNLKIF